MSILVFICTHFLLLLLYSIKKAARRTVPGSGTANGGIGVGVGGGGLFAGLKTTTTAPSLGFGVGSSGLGAGSLGRAPLSSISAGGQSNVMMSFNFNKKPASMDCK